MRPARAAPVPAGAARRVSGRRRRPGTAASARGHGCPGVSPRRATAAPSAPAAWPPRCRPGARAAWLAGGGRRCEAEPALLARCAAAGSVPRRRAAPTRHPGPRPRSTGRIGPPWPWGGSTPEPRRRWTGRWHGVSWEVPSGGGVQPGVAEHARQGLADTVAVARGRRAASRPGVAADGDQPVVAGVVLLAWDVGGDAEVAIRVQQVAGLPVAVPLVAQVDLAQAGVDAGGRRFAQGLVQSGAGLGAGGEAA